MTDGQKRAVENHRRRLRERGVGRFEVRGLEADKALIREVAQRLAQRDESARRLRAGIETAMDAGAERRGGVLAALRGSPLVGAQLDLQRETTSGRDVDL